MCKKIAIGSVYFLVLAALLISIEETLPLARVEAAPASGPCGLNSQDACADIGNAADEGNHFLTGWGSSEVGGPVLPPSADPSKRFQPLRGESTVRLKIPQPNVPYTLYTEVEDGGCDDSWAIYINGQGPVYSYKAQPGIDMGLAHQVTLAASYFPETNPTIKFRNLAGDNCGLAAVFFVKLERTDNSFCTLSGVPTFYQGWPTTPDSLPNKPEWYNHTYGNYPSGDTYNTVGRWGCNMTSNAMIVNYFAEVSASPYRTDPELLNNWLRSNGGYNSDNGVIYGKVAEYASSKLATSLTLTEVGDPDNNRLDEHLCSGNLAMLRVTTPDGNHYVAAIGKTSINGKSTYLIKDPKWGQTTLEEHYGGQYQAAYYYKGGNNLLNRANLEISAHSPVHILITDPIGRKIGYDIQTAEVWKEIPGAGYLIESINDPDGNQTANSKLVLIPQPLPGSYQLQIMGYATGSYTVNVTQTDQFGRTQTKYFTGTAQNGSVDEFSLLLATEAELYLPVITSGR